MDISPILTTALSTGLATALLNQGIAWWRESRKDKGVFEREGRYLAIRLAVLLERFAIDCANTIGDNDFFRTSGGHAGKWHGTLPDLTPYPEGDWRSLPPDLLSRCLTLRNELVLSEGQISFWEEVGERDCIPNATDEQAGKCGYRAWVLAEDMRKYYNLGAFDPKNTAWDVIKTIKEKHDDAVKRIQEKAA